MFVWNQWSFITIDENEEPECDGGAGGTDEPAER